MSASPNLAIPHVVANQNSKEVTINEAVDALDAGMTEMLTIEVDDTNAYVLTDDAFRRNFFIVVTEGSRAPTAAIALQVPAIRRGAGPVRRCAADRAFGEPDAVL